MPILTAIDKNKIGEQKSDGDIVVDRPLFQWKHQDNVYLKLSTYKLWYNHRI